MKQYSSENSNTLYTTKKKIKIYEFNQYNIFQAFKR